MFIRFGYLILTMLCWLPGVLSAQDNFKGVCDMPSKHCLAFVNQALDKAKLLSLQWSNLKLLQLDSLMTIKEFKSLKQKLDSLSHDVKHPPMFLTHLNIYRAKLLLIDGDEAQAKKLLASSIQDLKALNQSFYSPMRMINIANLQQNLKQYEQALTLLEGLETDFENSRDNFLKLELYGNLGHVHRLLENYPEALSYYKKSLLNAIELGGEQQIAVLYEHVGNMYKLTNQPALAEKSYLKALAQATKDGRVASITHAKIVLASFYLQQRKLEKVRMLTKDIDPAKIELHQQKNWIVIQGSLNPEKNP